jgi:hypothetical protein
VRRRAPRRQLASALVLVWSLVVLAAFAGAASAAGPSPDPAPPSNGGPAPDPAPGSGGKATPTPAPPVQRPVEPVQIQTPTPARTPAPTPVSTPAPAATPVATPTAAPRRVAPAPVHRRPAKRAAPKPHHRRVVVRHRHPAARPAPTPTPVPPVKREPLRTFMAAPVFHRDVRTAAVHVTKDTPDDKSIALGGLALVTLVLASGVLLVQAAVARRPEPR